MRHVKLNTFTGPFVLIEHDSGELMTTWLTPTVCDMLTTSRHDTRLLPELTQQLTRYFAGETVDFSHVALPRGGDFFMRCWDACRRIPRGETRTYGQLAELAGSTTAAARAAGQAMRTNPLPIIVPCHRVIGSGGKLHGFGGRCEADSKELGVKTSLLQMEGALNDPKLPRRRNTVRPPTALVTSR